MVGRHEAGLRVGRAIAMLACSSFLISCGPQWRRYEPENGHFAIDMPGAPETLTDVLTTPSGPVTLHGHYFGTGRWTGPLWTGVYMVAHSELVRIEDPQKSEELLRAERERVVHLAGASLSADERATPEGEQRVTLNGQPGLVLMLRAPSGRRAEARIYVSHGRLYSLFASDTHDRMARFFGSFVVL